MEYRDLETGATNSSRSLNIRRQWHKIPRAIRVYSVFGCLFLVSFILIYSFAKPLPNTIKDDDKDELLQQPEINNLQSEVPVKQAQTYLPVLGSDVSKAPLDSSKHVAFSYDGKPLERLTKDVWNSIQVNEQQTKIKAAIKHSWDAYRKYSWGKDYLKPISKTGHDWFGIGLTILDSLDTLLMAGMTKEYEEGLEWVKDSLTFEKNNDVNCFETTIRALGGLLSAYHISGDKILLERAEDLGGRLIHCFDSPSQIPYSDVNLKNRRARPPNWSVESSSSEVSSMQIEFRDLAYETDNKMYENKSYATSVHIHDLIVDRKDPLITMYINPRTGRFSPSVITLGARADSYYEYLYKQYLQVKDKFLLDDWMDAVDKIHEKLWRQTPGKLQLWYLGELFQSKDFSPKMDHLVCFLSGTLALSHYHETKNTRSFRGHVLDNTEIDKKLDMHLKMAEGLARTCHYMYNLTETGLSPEIAYFGMKSDEPEYMIRPADTHNLLRPEFVESLFFLYHITGKQIYREWGLQVFNAFEKYSKIPTGGYTILKDVRMPDRPMPNDKMESFWIAETLKYLYLLFTDDKAIIDALLNRYIFNTEGHIFPRRIV